MLPSQNNKCHALHWESFGFLYKTLTLMSFYWPHLFLKLRKIWNLIFFRDFGSHSGRNETICWYTTFPPELSHFFHEQRYFERINQSEISLWALLQRIIPLKKWVSSGYGWTNNGVAVERNHHPYWAISVSVRVEIIFQGGTIRDSPCCPNCKKLGVITSLNCSVQIQFSDIS